jgi:hypothetical protein
MNQYFYFFVAFAIGFFLSHFATNIIKLVITIGIIGGFGLFIYLRFFT